MITNRMKKYHIYSIVFVGLLGVSLIACSDDAIPYGEAIVDDYKISVSEQDQHLTFDMERSSTVHISAKNGIGWYVDSKPDWVSFGDSENDNMVGAKTLTVNVIEDNWSKDSRTDYIRLRTFRFGHEATISVEQTGGYINAPDSVNFAAMSETKSIIVTSNVRWMITTESRASLLSSVSPTYGERGTYTVSLTSKNNTKAQDIVEHLMIKPYQSASSIPSKNIQLKYEKVNLFATLTPNPYTFPQTGGTVSLKVESNFEWSIDYLDSWLTANPKTGKYNQTVTLKAGKNSGLDRECTFRIKSGDVTKWVTVGQKGLPIPGEDDNPQPQYSRRK